MKKVWGRIFSITAMLCLFAMPGHSSIVSKAAVYSIEEAGTIWDGATFNVAIKNLANGSSEFKITDYDKKIQKIVFLKKNLTSKEKKALEKQKKISVGESVDAYYDNGTISIYSTADRISFPKNSNNMFSYLSNVKSLDFGENRISAKNVETTKEMFDCCRSVESIDMHGFSFDKLEITTEMFYYCSNLKEVNLSNVSAPKLYDMQSTFSGCSRLKSINFQGFKPGNLFFTDGMFSGCQSLTDLDLSSFDTSKVELTSYMFNGCTGLKSLNLSTFHTPNLVKANNMFAYCRNLEYLDISNFDLSNLYDVEEMFMECYELRTIIVPKATRQVLEFIPLMAIDNDRNGVPDTPQTFHKNPISDRANRLIPYEDTLTAYAPKYVAPKTEAPKTEVIATENDITYKLSPEGTAAVTRINASGKVVVDSIKYNGVTYPVTSIEAAACKGNKKIKSLTIAKSVTLVGKDAFKGCKNLKKITIRGEKNIGKDAFMKIHKKAIITVKDIKGKQKKKFLKAIIKQTNAKVK